MKKKRFKLHTRQSSLDEQPTLDLKALSVVNKWTSWQGINGLACPGLHSSRAL